MEVTKEDPSDVLAALKQDNPLRYYRLQRGLSPREVASSLNIARQAYHNWERGARNISFRFHGPLAELLGVSRNDLFPELYESEETPDDTESIW